ncbi:MAG TPA: carbohydrate porin [Gammaproteobacteria bacterium]|nr:carbohydrate porin [Gammaproteobacteria bacterium]
MKRGLTAAAILIITGASGPAMADEAGTTTVHGTMFTDFSWIDQQQDGEDTSASGLGFDVKRFYFGAKHVFDDVWSANITTDFTYNRDDGETQVYVKKAYVEADLSPAAVFRAGSAAMPWIGFVESIEGYRYIDEMLIDRLSFGSSYDWGLHLGGTTAGGFSYATSLVNGGGYKNPSRSNGMDVAARISFEPVDGLIFGLGAYNGHRAQDFADAPAHHTATRYNALVAYVAERFRLGVEYFRADNWNNITTPAIDSANGYSAFASFDIDHRLSIFARYDHTDLSNDLNPSLSDKYYNLGVAWQAREGIEAAVFYKYEDRSSDMHTLETQEIGIAARIDF